MPPSAFPGSLVPLETHRLHLVCAGSGSPAVVLDAALGASSVSWTFVQPGVARITRVCAYDRAGFGWSDAGPMPRTASVIAGELHALLRRAEVPPPYVLVGHSFGGLVARIVAARYTSETAGLVLVDPAHPEEWLEPAEHQQAQIERGVRLCRYGATAARWGVARLIAALAGWGALTPARALVRLVSRGGLGQSDEAILAPVSKLPPHIRAGLSRFWVTPKFFEALGSQIESIRESAAETQRAGVGSLAQLPLTVISAATSSPRRRALNEALARTSGRGRHVMARQGGHWVPLDDPDVVVDEIGRMIAAIN